MTKSFANACKEIMNYRRRLLTRENITIHGMDGVRFEGEPTPVEIKTNHKDNFLGQFKLNTDRTDRKLSKQQFIGTPQYARRVRMTTKNKHRKYSPMHPPERKRVQDNLRQLEAPSDPHHSTHVMPLDSTLYDGFQLEL